MVDTIVDSCCLINLYAAGDVSSLLPALDLTLHVPSKVEEESLFIRKIAGGKRVLEPINLKPAIQASWLHVCSIEGEEELRRYVELATALDDGEAMCLAIADNREWCLATDDRKAGKMAGELGVSTITTPELMKKWADSTSASKQEITAALRNIQTCASFVPRAKSPSRGWWVQHVAG